MRVILILTVFFSYTTVFSQQIQQNDSIKKPTFWQNVHFGGGLGLGFGSNSTTIAISPSAIYDFQNGFAAGLGVGYQYSKINSFRANVFSASVLSLYNPIDEVQISAEFEQLFVNQKSGVLKRNFDYPALYLGAAYRIAQWGAIGLRYDVLYQENRTIYSSAFSPIIRFYF